jgi:hypothetical protein
MIENIGTMKLSDGEGEAIAIDYVLQSGGFYRLIIKHKNDVVFDVEEVNLGFPPECPGTADGRHEWPDSSKNTTVSCRACGKIRR